MPSAKKGIKFWRAGVLVFFRDEKGNISGIKGGDLNFISPDESKVDYSVQVVAQKEVWQIFFLRSRLTLKLCRSAAGTEGCLQPLPMKKCTQ